MLHTNFKGILGVSLLAAISCVFISNYSYAVSPSFTDDNGVEWVYNIDTSGDDPVLSIGFKSAPANMTTLHVPSLAEAQGKINDASLNDIDTYFVDDVLGTDTAGTIPAFTKVDMTDTSKVQLRSLIPALNSVGSNEVELVFGDNMVIADPAGTSPTAGDNFIPGLGAFEGLHLKLTNLNKVKYIGWSAFKGTTLNSASREITINSNQTVGGWAFDGSNVTKMTLDTENIPLAICRGCTSLTSVSFGDDARTVHGYAFKGATALAQTIDTNKLTTIERQAFEDSGVTGLTIKPALTRIGYGSFQNTQLGSLSIGNGHLSIGPRAFFNAGLSSVDFGSVEEMEALAFANNNLTELSLPKSIKSLTGAGIFTNNAVKKLTIAFDTFADSNGGSTPFATQFGCFFGSVDYDSTGTNGNNQVFNGNAYGSNWDCTVSPEDTVEEVILVAPYGENDSILTPASPYLDADEQNIVNGSKNILRPEAFYLFKNLKKITVGEGYEHIAKEAFFPRNTYVKMDKITELNLPDSLKGIGKFAFGGTIHGDVTLDKLPENIEYIGQGAFFGDYGLTIDDFDLPKLKTIGPSAFTLVSFGDMVLHDSVSFDSFPNPVFWGGLKKIRSLTMDTPYSIDIRKLFGWDNRSYFNDWTGSMYYAGYPIEGSIFSYNDNLTAYYDTKMEFGKIVFTEKANSSLYNYTNSSLIYIHADEVDLSAAPITTIPEQEFLGSVIGTLKLPQGLQEIKREAFYGATVTNPVTIPDTVTKIEKFAFMAGYDDRAADGVAIAEFPTSVREIGEAAFYKDVAFTADVDLPNLTNLGYSAFQGSGIQGIALHNGIQKLGYNAFFDTPNLKNVTIDVDIYNGVEHDYGDTSPYYVSSYCYQQSGEKCEGTEDEKRAQREANYYDSFVATFSKDANYGTITFTENAGEPCGGFANCSGARPYFFGIKADKIDLGDTNWKSTSTAMFQGAEIGELILPRGLETMKYASFQSASLGDVTMPTALKTIDATAFQWATATIDQLPEGLETIESAAFYGAAVTDDLVIPSTVTKIGGSAFNAGNKTVRYNSVTIKPDLTFNETSGQLIHQIFWGSKPKKLIIESSNLPALNAAVEDGYQEFYSMPIEEVVIKNLPGISYGAFEDCDKLTKVDMSEDDALRAIGQEAFLNDEVLNTIKFAPELKEETVTIGKNAFAGTAFETMGDASKDFDLTAAQFDGSEGYAFASMPKLRTVDIPRSFSGATIPRASFYNDTALEEATLDYKVTDMKNAAFAKDTKLEKIFIWGNTIVEDKNIGGYTEPTRAADDTIDPSFGPTIPENTDIYAYSVSPTKEYAAFTGRDDFDGTFYPLDEVIYLTSNKPTVLLEEDDSDFDKSGLIVYGLRRDGLVLESDEWAQYDGTVYARSAKPLTFEKMAATVAADPAFGTVYDTPVPIAELDLSNENFANISFALVPTDEDPAVRKINIVYTDKYTEGKPDTDIDPYKESEPEPEPEPTPTPEPEPEEPEPTPTPEEPETTPEPEKPAVKPETPKTGDEVEVYFAIFVGAVMGLTALAATTIIRKKILKH